MIYALGILTAVLFACSIVLYRTWNKDKERIALSNEYQGKLKEIVQKHDEAVDELKPKDISNNEETLKYLAGDKSD